MKKANLICLLFAGLSLHSACCQSSASPVAWWKFDEGHGDKVVDSAGGYSDQILNEFDWTDGISGKGLKFDGFTTVIERASRIAPKLTGSFTIDAWIALQSYPWNWVAIADQDDNKNAGYFFGIDAEGRLGLQVSVWGVWEVCRSEIRVPLNRWTHVTGVYDHATGIHLYINGKPEGLLPVIGDFTPAENSPLWIGRNLRDLPPVGLVRPNVSYPAKYSLDGILDDLKIYNATLPPAEIAASYDPAPASVPPPLIPRHWPVFKEQGTRLKAAYTRLKLYPEWDRLWRTGPYSDVVVSFGTLPVHYVFWRGANFGPNMVTEDGIWVSDQSFESSTKIGTAEHMNDKHDMHASISIVENNNARVVLHWRYALVDVLGNFADVDPYTDWGDWADEYFYIYPDGVAVRHGIIHGTRWKYSYTEPTLLLEPGKKPEDLISLQAVTIANSEGESSSYSWDPVSPPFPFPQQPPNANVALLNLKSRYRPFYIYRTGTILGPYGWAPELRPRYSHFPVWDHWPVNQIPSDGRFALFPDHFASSAIMSPSEKNVWIDGPGATKSTYFLFGLTDGSMSDLVLLDRSWLDPPEVKSADSNTVYDAGQRAYLVTAANEKIFAKRAITLTIEASGASPAVNPAFVIRGWGDCPIEVRIDGALVREDRYRVGYQYNLDGTNLVLWLSLTSSHPVQVSIKKHK